MAKIFAPNKQYDGISAGIQFPKGVGETSNPHLIDWFKSKGYTVELDAAESELSVPEPEPETSVEAEGAEISEGVAEPEAPKKRNTRKKETE